MAEWSTNPQWTPKEQINNGRQFSPDDVLSESDLNALIENMQYLYSNGGDFDVSNYPVGSIFMSTVSTSPASLFGGSWTRIQDRFLLAAGSSYTAGSTGGNATHSHDAGTLGATATMSDATILISSEQRSGLSYTPMARIKGSSRETPTNATNYIVPVVGSTASQNNIPPYLTVYMWKRTA